jgi:hypothetical protein
LLSVLVLAAALSLRNYDSFQLGTYVDDSSYVLLAQSLAWGEAYGLIHTPGQTQPTRYPFGFPLLLSPIARLWPGMPERMKLVPLGATLLNAGLLFWGWRFFGQERSGWWGLLIAALYATSPLVVGHTRMVMSEPVFLTAVLATLLLFERLRQAPARLPWAAAVGALATLAMFTRTIGVVLWIAIGLRMLLELPRRQAWASLAAAVAAGTLVLLLVVAGTPVAASDLLPVDYAEQFRRPEAWDRSQVPASLALRLFEAASGYAAGVVREAIIPLGGGAREMELGRRLGVADLPAWTGLAVSAVVAAGSLGFRRGRGLSRGALVFLGLYLGALCLWPWQDSRLLYPVQPFLFCQFLTGLGLIAGWLGRVRAGWLSGAAITLASGAILAVAAYKGATDQRTSLDFSRDFRVGATWLRQNTAEDTLVMAQHAHTIYLYSRRGTVGFPAVEDAEQLQAALAQLGADYILMGPRVAWRLDGSLEYTTYTRTVLLPALEALASTGQLNVVYESPEDLVRVYQVAGRP